VLVHRAAVSRLGGGCLRVREQRHCPALNGMGENRIGRTVLVIEYLDKVSCLFETEWGWTFRLDRSRRLGCHAEATEKVTSATIDLMNLWVYGSVRHRSSHARETGKALNSCGTEPTSSGGDMMVEGGEFYILISVCTHSHLPLPLEGGQSPSVGRADERREWYIHKFTAVQRSGASSALETNPVQATHSLIRSAWKRAIRCVKGAPDVLIPVPYAHP
jgi:hypothetical protein